MEKPGKVIMPILWVLAILLVLGTLLLMISGVFKYFVLGFILFSFSFFLLPPVASSLAKRIRWKRIITIPVLYVLFFLFFFILIIIGAASQVKYANRVNPTSSSSTVQLPVQTIRYSCSDDIREVKINGESLDEAELEELCTSGYKVRVLGGKNVFEILFIGEKEGVIVKQVELLTINFEEELFVTNYIAELKDQIVQVSSMIDQISEHGGEVPEEIVDGLPEVDSINSAAEVLSYKVQIARVAQEVEEQLEKAKEATYEIIAVVDGDTVKIMYEDEIKTVRLIGIDTPETAHPNKEVECFGQEAADKMRELVEGKQVRISFDDSQDRIDKYARLLLYLWVEDTFINSEMIKQGYAYEYTYKLPYKYKEEFKTAQSKAEESKLGLWGDACACEQKELASDCSGCNKRKITYQRWDCSTYEGEVTDAGCMLNCPAKSLTSTSSPKSTVDTPTNTKSACCKICLKGKACGDSCISRSYTCHKGPGCACNGY